MRAEKLADKVSAPWRMAIVLASVTAGASLATWLGNEGILKQRTSTEPVYVHVKVSGHDLSAEENVTAFVSSVPTFATDDQPLEALEIGPVFVGLPDDITDDRARWIRVKVASRAEAERWVREQSRKPWIEEAFVEPETTLPRSDDEPFPADIDLIDLDARLSRDDGESCPIKTPSFESYQGYLGPAPGGIDAPAAWRRGQRGQGIWFADVEGGWNAQHEDLPGDRITHVVGRPMNDPSWRAHGTAVLGEVVGRDNGKGVVGIAPDVEKVFTASIDGASVANAIDTAARKLRAGDVLLIELQRTGPRGRFLPVEFWDDIYDTIAAATKRGVVIIEAAGNGAEDLDHKEYRGKFDRKKRDSGAIMIGAGAPPREGFKDREKLDFSNYGGRVDVQGWGRKVATLDYGDLQSCDSEEAGKRYTDRHYTGQFSGTSSASPIVAGAAVLLEGIARTKGKELLPAALREILRKTGTPQAGNTAQHIGPRPDLARAVDALDQFFVDPCASDGCMQLWDR